MHHESIKIGAVIYDPKVTVIWGIIADFFRQNHLDVECLFYKDYRTQVDALLAAQIDIAWNSPLAWIDSVIRSNHTCTKSAMRDTDQDRSTVFLARANSTIQTIQDLKNKKIGFGAVDSPQARLIPINHLANHGLVVGKDYEEVVFNIGYGLHGDHVGGEYDALEALKQGTVDASVCVDLNYEAWRKDGTIDETQIVCFEKTPLFDHCIFTVREGFLKERLREWEAVLFKMDYTNPKHKEMMDMEGLKQWVDGRTSGFAQLQEAVERLNFFK
ncbi:MAG: PhnD/SsuA/transferrin family substrate-binding protein [Campylobacterales bacterium]|nr:PhnD/SsuA/transferrin family substrate-binding protein [Campylobacterales bacterium]